MAEEPPRPAIRGSNASATSVWASSEMSMAILPTAPTRMARALARPATAPRWACQGVAGRGQVQARGQALGDGQGLAVQSGQRAGRAAELQAQGGGGLDVETRHQPRRRPAASRRPSGRR
jgi:hypothetical protein